MKNHQLDNETTIVRNPIAQLDPTSIMESNCPIGSTQTKKEIPKQKLLVKHPGAHLPGGPVGGILDTRKVGPYDRYKWSYNLHKWPYKWVTGVITPFITDRGPPCGTLKKCLSTYDDPRNRAFVFSGHFWPGRGGAWQPVERFPGWFRLERFLRHRCLCSISHIQIY